MPRHKAGDVLLVLVAARGTDVSSITSAEGSWDLITTVTGSPTQYLKVYYKIATSDAMGVVNIVNGTNSQHVYIASVADCDVADIVNGYASAISTNAQNIQAPALTTDEDDCLLLTVNSNYSSTLKSVWKDDDLVCLGRQGGTNLTSTFGYNVQKTAGAIAQPYCYCQDATVDSCVIVLALNNATGGSTPPYPKAGTGYVQVGEFGFPVAHTDLNNFTLENTYSATGITTLNGVAVGDELDVVAVTPADTLNYLSYLGFGGALLNVWNLGTLVLPASINFTGKLVQFLYYHQNTPRMNEPGAVVIFVDTSGNWAAYNIKPKAAFVAEIIYQMTLDVAETPNWTSGTIDWTDVNRLVFGYLHSGSSAAYKLGIHGFRIVDPANPIVILGGGPNAPIDGWSLKRILDGWNAPYRFDARGVAQFNHPAPIQIGDGTAPCYFDTAGASYETPQKTLFSAKLYDNTVGENRNGLIIKACAACTIKMRQGIMASAQRGFIKFDSGGNASANYDFIGESLRNYLLTALSGVSYASMIIAISPETDCKDATFTSCIWDRPSETYGCKMDAGGSLINCSFVSAEATDYAVRIPAAGTYTISNVNFSGYTTAIHVTATTGTVTLNVAGDTPTYTSEGATVVVVTSAILTVAGVIAGSRIKVTRTDTDAVLVNDIIAGTSEEFELGYGGQVRVELRNASGSPAYKPWFTIVTVGTAITVTALQEID